MYLADFSTDWLTCLLTDWPTDWLTYLLTPSDKHNSRTAWARDLISSLINVASSWDLSFHQPQQLQCLHHGTTFIPLWSPILSSQSRKVTICGRHLMASVRGIQLACCVMSSTLRKLKHYGSHVSKYGAHVSQVHILSIFSLMARWIAEICTFYVVLCLYCCVKDRA